MKRCIKLIIVVGIIAAVVVGVYAFAKSSARSVVPQSVTDQVAVPVPPVAVKNIPILVYHSIAPVPPYRESALQKRFRISPENFDAQMKYLTENGYTPIRFDMLADYLLHDSPIPEKPVVLTFDDGLLNQYEHAFPILEKYDFVGTFFVYPGVTGHRGFMTWEQVVAVDKAGNEIASHTVIHENLPTLTDPEKLRHEIWDSKTMLEKKLGHTVTTFAYPHYAENESVRKLIEEAGYIAARAGWRDVQNSAGEIFHLKSQEARDSTNPFSTK